MKRVLLIGSVDIYGGVGHMILEFCRNINKDVVHFDFLYYDDISAEAKKIIDSYNGTFYKIPRYSKQPFQFYQKIKEFFQTHEYDVVHIHASTSMLIMYALPVWRSEKTKIFYQSHSDCVEGTVNKTVHFFSRRLVVKYANCKMAVSEAAARFMYGKKRGNETLILKNGINIKKYEFNEEIRKEIRKDLDINSDFVLGHVGRFTYSKNHPFIIEVFKRMCGMDSNLKLLLVGSGEDEDKIKQMVRERNLSEKVIFYGISNHVEELLCAMDCFIFPSNYEGLGIVALEAQANGLPVVASDRVPEETNVTELYRILSLTDDSSEVWANTILAFKEKKMDRKLRHQDLISKGYDIKETANKLEKIYLDA